MTKKHRISSDIRCIKTDLISSLVPEEIGDGNIFHIYVGTIGSPLLRRNGSPWLLSSSVDRLLISSLDRTHLARSGHGTRTACPVIAHGILSGRRRFRLTRLLPVGSSAES